MALRFLDGFDHYATADLLKKWTGTSGLSVTAGAGRRSTAGGRIGSTGSYVHLALDNQPTWSVGVAFRAANLPAFNSAGLIEMRDGTSVQVDVRFNPAGAIYVTRGGSTVLGTASVTLPTSTYTYVEIYATIDPAAGVIMVAVNGVLRLSLTSQNTRQTANAYANALRIGQLDVSMGQCDFDDIYICDGTGAAPHNTLLGDCRVDTLFPNADGTAQQWTPSTPGTHYTLVDEAAPNTTDYVSDATSGHRDTYGMQDLTALTGTIYGVQLSLAALKSDAGARSIKPLILSSSSEALGTATALATGQTYTRHVQVTDPATAAAWTEAGVNAAQCGAEVA